MMKKMLFGVGVLAVGILILLANLDVISIGLTFRKIWPVFVLAFGIGDMIDARKINITGIVLTVIGAYFILYNFSIINISFMKVAFPLILILIGLYIIFSKKNCDQKIKDSKSDITLSSTFSSIENKCISKKFKKATITTIFGGATLDLRDADTVEECFCESTVIFGGADIFVPENWNINTDNVTCIFGGVENTRRNVKEADKTLYLTGLVLFGGIEIK